MRTVVPASPWLQGEEHLGSVEAEQTQVGLWERGCGVFTEGNDVERHLDRPPGASPFPDWVEQASAEQGSSENSHVSQSSGGLCLGEVTGRMKAPLNSPHSAAQPIT